MRNPFKVILNSCQYLIGLFFRIFTIKPVLGIERPFTVIASAFCATFSVTYRNNILGNRAGVVDAFICNSNPMILNDDKSISGGFATYCTSIEPTTQTSIPFFRRPFVRQLFNSCSTAVAFACLYFGVVCVIFTVVFGALFGMVNSILEIIFSFFVTFRCDISAFLGRVFSVMIFVVLACARFAPRTQSKRTDFVASEVVGGCGKRIMAFCTAASRRIHDVFLSSNSMMLSAIGGINRFSGISLADKGIIACIRQITKESTYA